MFRVWVGVVSREHVQIAVAGKFCQLNHGKEAAVRRLHRGDKIIYYSPRSKMKDGEALQAFTALGAVTDDEPFQVKQGEGFHPFRRHTHYFKTQEAPIHALLKHLDFTKGRSNWGMILRRGTFKISHEDFSKIAKAMGLSAIEFGHS